MLIIIKKTQDYGNKNIDSSMRTIRTKRRTCDCAQSTTQADFSESSAIDMEAQVNVNHELRGPLPDLVNKRMNTNICNTPSTSFYRNYVVCQMILVLIKKTYDMRGLTYFLTCEVNIMSLFLLGNSWVLPLREASSNKLRGYIWEINEQSTIMLKIFICQPGVACISFKNISSRSCSKARKCLARK